MDILRKIAMAGAAGAASLVATIACEYAFFAALLGPSKLQEPTAWGIAGPPLAYTLLRPTIVMAVTVAVVVFVVALLFIAEHARNPATQRVSRITYDSRKGL